MLATIELITLTTEACSACGQAHELRAALAPEDESAAGALLGFFGRCPVADRRAWLVVRVPERADGCGRLVRMGPVDDLAWEPVPADDLERSEPDREPAVTAGAGQGPSTRGLHRDGFRGNTRAPELLRLALGCPHASHSLR